MSTSPQPTTVVAVYLRVSSDEQRERQSIETQRVALERYIKEHGLPVFTFYADDGISGTIPLQERPEGARLLTDAQAGKFRTVLLYNLRRLGREALITLLAIDSLERCGVEICSITQNLDLKTPHGRFMAVIECGVAGYERDTMVQHSIEGTERLARAGAWLGGIVPYGYRVVGRHKDARLMVAGEPLPGLDLSEAEVIRLIYRLTVEEHWSCVQIAGHLEQLGVPPSYTKDNRLLLRGKRQVTTSGIWRPGRVRNMLANPTYMGIHEYGRRSAKEREVIRRPVPAIVSPEVWHRAQEVLREHQRFSRRNAKHSYLLRGLIKCGLCGLTYSGSAWSSPAGKEQRAAQKRYYICNGKNNARGIYGLKGEKCPSRTLNADLVEATIWQDIEEFRRNPDPVLEELTDRMTEGGGVAAELQAEVARVQRLLTALTRSVTASSGCTGRAASTRQPSTGSSIRCSRRRGRSASSSISSTPDSAARRPPLLGCARPRTCSRNCTGRSTGRSPRRTSGSSSNSWWRTSGYAPPSTKASARPKSRSRTGSSHLRLARARLFAHHQHDTHGERRAWTSTAAAVLVRALTSPRLVARAAVGNHGYERQAERRRMVRRLAQPGLTGAIGAANVILVAEDKAGSSEPASLISRPLAGSQVRWPARTTAARSATARGSLPPPGLAPTPE